MAKRLLQTTDRAFQMIVSDGWFGSLFRTRIIAKVAAFAMRFLTIVSSRDFFALLFAVLILVGVPMAVLYIFATAATIWMAFLAVSLLDNPARRPATDRS